MRNRAEAIASDAVASNLRPEPYRNNYRHGAIGEMSIGGFMEGWHLISAAFLGAAFLFCAGLLVLTV